MVPEENNFDWTVKKTCIADFMIGLPKTGEICPHLPAVVALMSALSVSIINYRNVPPPSSCPVKGN